MNPDYLWLTGAVQLLTFFLVAPVLAIAIAYTAWLQKPKNLNSGRYGTWCVVSGVIAFLMLVFAKWLNADVRTPQYFLQLGAILLSSLFSACLWGVASLRSCVCCGGTRPHDWETITPRDSWRNIGIHSFRENRARRILAY